MPGEARRCAGGADAGDGDRQPAEVAAGRASAAGCVARSVDPPKRLNRLI